MRISGCEVQGSRPSTGHSLVQPITPAPIWAFTLDRCVPDLCVFTLPGKEVTRRLADAAHTSRTRMNSRGLQNRGELAATSPAHALEVERKTAEAVKMAGVC